MTVSKKAASTIPRIIILLQLPPHCDCYRARAESSAAPPVSGSHASVRVGRKPSCPGANRAEHAARKHSQTGEGGGAEGRDTARAARQRHGTMGTHRVLEPHLPLAAMRAMNTRLVWERTGDMPVSPQALMVQMMRQCSRDWLVTGEC